MKINTANQFNLWRSKELFTIDFASYSFSQHSFPRHFHQHYVIELVLQGTDDFYCAGKNYRAEPDQLVLINPGEVHTGSTVADTPLQYFSLYPDRSALEQVAAALDITIPRDFSFPKSLQRQSFLTQKLQALADSFISGKDKLLQQEYFFVFMQELLQQKAGKPGPAPHTKDQRVKQLTDFIHLQFREDISLQQMAGLVNLNPFHLIRLFKKNTGVSPYDYLLILRTEWAKQLLRKGYKVQEAALEAGFYDPSHLNRSLRKIAGTSPKSFLLSKGQYRTSFNG
ncbi:MAG: AraC family transcriptional regulator [Bacteroidota bacterium]